MAPDFTSSRILMLQGWNRVHTASMRNSFFSLAFSTSSLACSAVTVNAFSHSTCLPASSASMAFWKWWLCGVAT